MIFPFWELENCQRVISPDLPVSSALYSASIACLIAALVSDAPISPDKGPLASSLYLEFPPIHELLKREGVDFESEAVVVPLFVVAHALSIARHNTETIGALILPSKQENIFIGAITILAIFVNLALKGKQ